MNADLLALFVMAVLIAAPLLLERYWRQLPIAPSCPSCRWVAREVSPADPLLSRIPIFARTFIAECGRCGWRGRMRWRLAPDPAGNRRGA